MYESPVILAPETTEFGTFRVCLLYTSDAADE